MKQTHLSELEAYLYCVLSAQERCAFLRAFEHLMLTHMFATGRWQVLSTAAEMRAAGIEPVDEDEPVVAEAKAS
jgi:hypothetical protein